MYLLVCGSRHYDNYEYLSSTLSHYTITEIVHGTATGADSLAARYASENNIAVRPYPAEWHYYGRGAGPIRNRKMMEYLVSRKEEGHEICVIAFDSSGPGTRSMLSIAAKEEVKTMMH